MYYSPERIEKEIEAFKVRMETELEFCKELFHTSSVRLMAMKYSYYVLADTFATDDQYDICESGWYVMGRALGVLKVEDTSPCIGWDESHPDAIEGIALARRFLKI